MAKKNKKPTYTLKAETGYLQSAKVVNVQQLMAMTKMLLDRLDDTTAYLMTMKKELEDEPGDFLHTFLELPKLDQMVKDNMAVLDQFRQEQKK